MCILILSYLVHKLHELLLYGAPVLRDHRQPLHTYSSMQRPRRCSTRSFDILRRPLLTSVRNISHPSVWCSCSYSPPERSKNSSEGRRHVDHTCSRGALRSLRNRRHYFENRGNRFLKNKRLAVFTKENENTIVQSWNTTVVNIIQNTLLRLKSHSIRWRLKYKWNTPLKNSVIVTLPLHTHYATLNVRKATKVMHVCVRE